MFSREWCVDWFIWEIDVAIPGFHMKSIKFECKDMVQRLIPPLKHFPWARIYKSCEEIVAYLGLGPVLYSVCIRELNDEAYQVYYIFCFSRFAKTMLSHSMGVHIRASLPVWSFRPNCVTQRVPVFPWCHSQKGEFCGGWQWLSRVLSKIQKLQKGVPLGKRCPLSTVTGHLVSEEFRLFTAVCCRNLGFDKCTIWYNYPMLSYQCR
jgi:hypothetical protein